MLFLGVILFFSFCFHENFAGSETNLTSDLKVVRPHSYPFIVTIVLEMESYGWKTERCVGTLISKQYVVTAAHCIVLGGNNGFQLSNYEVGVGVHRVRHPHDLISIDSITLHPSYDRETLDNDIALIKLSTAVEFSDIIRPMCLLDMPVDHIFRRGTIAGFSYFPNNISTEVLIEGDASIWSNSDCNRTITITSNQICIGGNGSSTCFVHSGSPLFATFNEKYYFLGFAIFVISECPSIEPNGYLRVPPFINWIKQNSDYSGEQCAIPNSENP